MAKKTAVAEATVFRSKIGTARQVPGSRIWLEGKRLVDIGFTVGKNFVKEWDEEAGTLTLTLVGKNDILATAPCTVSGKGEKPIIDITGAQVREFFCGFAFVSVSFCKDSRGSSIHIQGCE
jgi:hypothetical protein